jgi:hypothetical protein
MIKLSNLLNEIKVNKPGAFTIYVGEPTRDLFQIENFPALNNVEGIPYDYDDENPKFWQVIDKIQDYLQIFDISNMSFSGDFSNRTTAYIYIDGELNYTIVDSLEQFEEGYQTKEDFGVQTWKKI